MRLLATLSSKWSRLDPAVRYAAYGAAGLVGLALLYAVATRDEGIMPETLRLNAPGAAKSEPIIARLHVSIQQMARTLLEQAWGIGIGLVVTQGYRTLEEQERLYQQGRTTPGPIVTNAKPGSSLHNFGLAFDVAVVDEAGNPSWPNDAALWRTIGEVGKSVGLEWGGDFNSYVDLPHFQHTGGYTLAEIAAGERPTVYA